MPFKKSEDKKKYMREYLRGWRHRNRDRYNAYQKEWRRKNPDKVKAIKKRYERKLREIGGGKSGEKRRRVD